MISVLTSIMKQYESNNYSVNREKLIYANLIDFAIKNTPIPIVSDLLNKYIQDLIFDRKEEIENLRNSREFKSLGNITTTGQRTRESILEQCFWCLVMGRQETVDTMLIDVVYPEQVRGDSAIRHKVKYKITDIIFDIFQNPLMQAKIEEYYIDHNLFFLAKAIVIENRYEDLPVLADSLEERGCISKLILNHCRECPTHYQGCWVPDMILKLGKERFDV